MARIEQLEARARVADVALRRRRAARTSDIYDRYHDIERENNNLANLYVASFQLHSTMELRELTQIILEILLNFVGAKTFAIQLVDEEHGKLRTLAAEGDRARARCPSGARRRGAHRRGRSRAGTTTSTASGCARAPIWRTSIGRSSSCRSRFATSVVGVVIIWDLLSQKTALADVDYELFNLLAAHAASALQGAWLAAELEGRAPHLWAAADQV